MTNLVLTTKARIMAVAPPARSQSARRNFARDGPRENRESAEEVLLNLSKHPARKHDLTN